MKGRFRKTALAAAAALLVVSGNVPIKPAADLFGGVVVTVSAAEVASGTCGDNAEWSLDDAGTLTISGTGDIMDIFPGYTQPWYNYKYNITSVDIENGITSIGWGAFRDCAALKSVTIPDSVTSIGSEAFRRCEALTSVEIPKNVTSFGDSVFSGCESLTSVEIPNSVTSIGLFAFDGCTGLTSISISNSVTSIDSYAFRSCTSLTSIAIPAKVTNIGANAFQGCTGIKDVYCDADPLKLTWNDSSCDDFKSGKGTTCYVPGKYLDNYNEEFGKSVNVTFKMNPALPGGKCGENARWEFDPTTNKLTISGKGTMYDYVYDYNTSTVNTPWFAYKDNITSVEIENGITSIDDYVFSNCTSLTSVEIPNSVTSIGDSAFFGCTRLTSVEIPNRVTSIGDSVFSGCTSLTSIAIPAKVTSIGDYAFFLCESLTSVEIPNSVTSIGIEAFYFCTDLTSIKIPNSVTSIGNDAFYGCASLTSVEIPGSVTSIGDYAFSECALTSVNIPDSVTSIGDYVFWNCTSLTSVEIPNSVTSIGDGAFDGCTNLTSVTISDSVTSIGSYLFNGCGSLTSVTIPNSVTSIGSSAFQGCESLTSVKIPGSVTSIGNDAFHGCTGLTSVTIPNSVTRITDGAFSGCESLTSVNIPNSVTSIGSEAFRGCKGLTSVEIPNSVTSIGDNAFSECTGLTSIAIPAKVTYIDTDAFLGCTGIKDVYCYADPENLTWVDDECNDFKPGKATVCHVPAEHLGYYQTHFSHVNVRFVTDVTVTVADGITNGTVTADKTKVYSGDTVKLTVTPAAGYAAKSVTVNGTEITPVNGVYSFTVPAENVTVSAEFEKQKCAVTLPDHMEIINGVVLTEGKADYGTEIIFKVSDGYTASNVKNGETELIPDLSGIYTVTVEGDTVITAEIQKNPYEIRAYCLRLNGDIGLDVYFGIDDSVIKDVTRMVITLPNGGKQTVYTADFDRWEVGIYCFSAKVAAKEMTDNVHFELYTNDTAPVYTADVSVRDAAQEYLDSEKQTEETKSLVRAMLNYGAYSQLYFGHNIANLANAGYVDNNVSTVTAEELKGYQYDPTTEDLPEGLSFAKVNLTLESETSLNLYFTDNTGANVSYTSDLGTVVVTEEKGFTKVAIKNIPAEKLGSYATVTITVDGRLYSVKYSPMTYCYNTLTRENTDDLRNCMRAFYLYNKEAVVYSTSMQS